MIVLARDDRSTACGSALSLAQLVSIDTLPVVVCRSTYLERHRQPRFSRPARPSANLRHSTMCGARVSHHCLSPQGTTKTSRLLKKGVRGVASAAGPDARSRVEGGRPRGPGDQTIPRPSSSTLRRLWRLRTSEGADAETAPRDFRLPRSRCDRQPRGFKGPRDARPRSRLSRPLLFSPSRWERVGVDGLANRIPAPTVRHDTRIRLQQLLERHELRCGHPAPSMVEPTHPLQVSLGVVLLPVAAIYGLKQPLAGHLPGAYQDLPKVKAESTARLLEEGLMPAPRPVVP